MSIKNRHGYTVELSVIDKVDMDEQGGCSIRQANGWSLFISATELDGFVPQAEDVLVVYTHGFNEIAGLVIDHRVLRYKTPEQLARERQTMLDGFRLRDLENYLANGESLKERVKSLHPAFQSRMNRFDAKDGINFWINDAGYEMAVLEGAQALLNAVDTYGEYGLELIEYWDAYSSKSGGYQHDKQLELVPGFGDGHSGNTYSAAVTFAKMVLRGQGDKL